MAEITPTPSQPPLSAGAVPELPVVAWLDMYGNPFLVVSTPPFPGDEPLALHAPAQATIHAQAAEIERIAAHNQTLQRDLDAACDGESKWQADYMRLSDELAALKAKQVAEAEEAMRLADEWVVEAIHAALSANTGHATLADPEAAREALRSFLTKDRT